MSESVPGQIQVLPDGTALLRAAAHANHKWWVVLSEWIDNAFDANAKTIAFEFVKDALRIYDDGTGCADPLALVRLGGHEKHRTTKLGRYGIGGKEAALWVGGLESKVQWTSTHQGHVYRLHVNWREYGQSWHLTTPSSEPSDSDVGTTILISPLTKKPPHGKSWDELKAEIAYLYSPALKQGRQIKFRRATKGAEWEPLVRWELPILTDIIDVRIEVRGHRARVYCGVVEGANPRSGFTYCHEWRVIEAASSNGCGMYSSARVCGFVDLDSSWPLTKNKDGITTDREELYAEVARVAEPVLRKAEAASRDLCSRQFETAVSSQLNSMLEATRAKVKARRNKREKPATPGTVPPSDTGRTHKQAEKEQAGNRFPSRSGGGGWRISAANLGPSEELGQVKPPEVLLNLANPAVQRAWRENETAILFAAVALISAEHITTAGVDGKQMILRLPGGLTTADFSKAAGTILASNGTLSAQMEKTALDSQEPNPRYP